MCAATNFQPVFNAALRNVSHSVGAGLRGKPMAKLDIGGDFSHTDIKDAYFQQPLTAGNTSASPLPDISTRLTRFNLFAKYALEKKNSGVRLDYIYDRFSTNDYTWTTFTYVDGTTVNRDPNQSVHFIGVSYYYRWQ